MDMSLSYGFFSSPFCHEFGITLECFVCDPRVVDVADFADQVGFRALGLQEFPNSTWPQWKEQEWI